jgi:hypothetical protein
MTEYLYLVEKIKKLLYEMSSIHATIERRDMIADFRDENSNTEEDAEYDIRKTSESMPKTFLS